MHLHCSPEPTITCQVAPLHGLHRAGPIQIIICVGNWVDRCGNPWAPGQCTAHLCGRYQWCEHSRNDPRLHQDPLHAFQPHHYVVMVRIGVKSVLTTVEIVCGIIDAKDVVLVDTTTLEQHLVEGGLWCIVAAVKAQQGTTSTWFCNVQMDWPDARVEVVFQLCSKWGTKYIHTAMAGSSGFWLIKRLRTIGLCWDFPML